MDLWVWRDGVTLHTPPDNVVEAVRFLNAQFSGLQNTTRLVLCSAVSAQQADFTNEVGGKQIKPTTKPDVVVVIVQYDEAQG